MLQIAGEPLSVIDQQLAKMHKDNQPADDTTEAIDKAWEEEMVDFWEQNNKTAHQTKPNSVSQTYKVNTLNAKAEVPVHWVDFNQSAKATTQRSLIMNTTNPEDWLHVFYLAFIPTSP